ncbi:MAG: hypothetical protein WKG07_21955 [Hymenobacter sp.]
MNFLKVRASVGRVGNQNLPSTLYIGNQSVQTPAYIGTLAKTYYVTGIDRTAQLAGTQQRAQPRFEVGNGGGLRPGHGHWLFE